MAAHGDESSDDDSSVGNIRGSRLTEAATHVRSSRRRRISSVLGCQRSSAALNLTLSCGFYLVSSAGMSIFNKCAITALPLPITLAAPTTKACMRIIIAACTAQMLFTVGTTLVGWRSVHIGSLSDALRWGCTVPMLFSAMLVRCAVYGCKNAHAKQGKRP
eukprot:6185345-Pleurochrysis_carterae.AAC.1